MDANNFAQIVREVRNDAINDTISFFTKPPGRKPRKRHLDISNWLNSLNNDDQYRVRELIKESIDTSLFGLLCILDGVRVIESEENRGHFKLFYYKDNQEILLNNPEKEDLHDIYNYLIQNEQTE
jgi:hypothetical protein